MPQPLRRTILTTLLAALFTLAVPAFAQSDKVMRIILPVATGSGVDTTTRTVGPAFAKALGQSIVIENQPGAGGIIGTHALVKSTPDGRTISFVSNNHVIFPSVYKSLPFDPVADITPIAVIGNTPIVLVVNAKNVAAKTVPELVAMMTAKPNSYNYASSGNGTILHLAGEMFMDEAGVQARHIPYKGVGPMVTDLIGGQVEMGMLALPSVQQHIRTGALRAIAISGKERIAAAPEIPTFAEQGLPGYAVEAWFAVIAPAKLPLAEAQRIRAALVEAFAAPEVREAMAKQGNSISVGPLEAAAPFFRSELAKYAKLVKKAGIEPPP